MNKIIKCAAIIVENRSVLLTRKRGTSLFISPGGKLNERETPMACLKRELLEELSVDISSAVLFGLFSDKAEFEDRTIEITAYEVKIKGIPKASAEIEEIKWVKYADLMKGLAVGSIFAKQVLPMLYNKGIID